MISRLTTTTSIFVQCLIGAILFLHFSVDAQNSQTQFGKNRIQYHKFKWFEYETDNFMVYWYGEGRNIGISVAQLAEWDYREIQETLEHRINRKIEILVFTDITDMKQSNIGNEETFRNTGGEIKIVENKIFVHFNGDHNDLRRQVREGIASVSLNNMMFGTNIQEIVQNAVLLNLPEWFSQGLIGYAGEKWNTHLDNQLRDIFMSGTYKDFEDFASENPKLAGHSLWYYVENNYGRSTASNLIYLTRINRSVDSGFLYVLGSPFGRVIEEWKNYFNERYKTTGGSALPPETDQISIRNKRELPISEAKLSPDGRKLAYAFNEKGKIRVFVHDLETDKRSRVFKTGFRNHIQETDYNYPLLAWSPDNQYLGILYEKRDIVYFEQINPESREKITQEFAPQYQRIYSVEYINSNDLLISGTIKGFSDVFIYHINQRSTDRITNDFYDDLDPAYVDFQGRKGILFSSNRGDVLELGQFKLDSILPIGASDIYFFDMESEESNELVRITNTPYANESHPFAVDSVHYGFLSDDNGIRNRYAGELEEYISHHERVVLLKTGNEIILPSDSIPDYQAGVVDTTYVRPVMKWRGKNHASSNYSKGIHEVFSSSGKVVENIRHRGLNRIYVRDMEPETSVSLLNSDYKQQVIKQKTREIQKKEEEQKERETPREKPADWEFDPGFGEETEPQNNEVGDVEPEKPVEEEKTTAKEFDFVFVPDYLEEMDDELVEEEKQKEEIPSNKEEEDLIDIDNYEFENDFEPNKTEAAVIVESDDGRITLQSPGLSYAKEVYRQPTKRVHRFVGSKALSHRLRFKSNTITVQMDNSLLFGGLDLYTGNPYNHQPLSIFLKSSIQDVFEDYELEGGLRLPISFDGVEYFVTFKDLKKRLDKSYTYYRETSTNTFDVPGFFLTYKSKTTTNLVQTDLKYAMDIYGSLRARVYVRGDKFEYKATDRPSLEVPSYNAQRIGLRLEYVFDNTIDIDDNLKHGTRLKIYTEALKRMELDVDDGFNLNFNGGFIFMTGADIRHYQRLGKHTVLAARVSGATSFGSEKMIFFLGGADNEMFPSLNENIPLPEAGGDFAYQTIATPLRGFRTNIRNGNSYVLGNLELRLPIFKYLYKRPIKSSLIRHFQIVGFFDVGTAWQGVSPFSDDNPLNTSVFAPPPEAPQVITATVNYYRDPIVAGFGAGVRTKIFGYFIRVDYGKGIETKIIQPGVWHISIGTDF